MKSAYEIAMGKFGGDESVAKLTDDQRRELAEIDSKYEAKIAEQKLFLEGQIAATGDVTEIAQLQEQLKREISRLESDRAEAKDKVRNR